MGFDFDLTRYEGSSPGERRAAAVRAVFSPRAHPVAADELVERYRRVVSTGEVVVQREPIRLPRPIDVLNEADCSSDPVLQRAAEALRARLPLPSSGRTLAHEITTPRELVDFDRAHTQLGVRVMLGARWYGIKPIS